jgi:Domain of unknown function (DUF4105)
VKKSILVLLLIASLSAHCQTISKDAIVSLITLGPAGQDDELYTAFGHSAIRIQDYATGLDNVYNYGAFNFNTEGFIIKFMRGQLLYRMDIQEFGNEIPYWQHENRQVDEQILELSPKQKVDLYQFLNHNFLPENRFYQYKFFFDNCSTRIGDIFKTVLKDSVQFSTTLNAGKSYRQWIDSCTVKQKPWSDFGMDLAIGVPSDAIADAKGALFLPMNLKASFDSAKVKTVDGKWISIIKSKNSLTMVNEKRINYSWFNPMFITWLLFLVTLAITIYQYFSQSGNRFVFDKILFFIAGIAGIIIFLLWFATNHGVTEYNFNIIWAFPFLLYFAFNLKQNTKPTFFLIYGLALIGFLISWKFLPQEINIANLPIVLTLMIRSFFVWDRLR